MNPFLPPAVSFSNFGAQEILLILLIVLLFFGGRKLPELARALGRSLREFRKGQREESPSAQNGDEDRPAE